MDILRIKSTKLMDCMRGMTLIQSLIVVALVIIIAVLSFPRLRENRRVSQAVSDVNQIAGACEKFCRHTGQERIDFDHLISNPDIDGWRGKYLDKIPKNPWGGEYVIVTKKFKVGIPQSDPKVPEKYKLGGLAEISKTYKQEAYKEGANLW